MADVTEAANASWGAACALGCDAEAAAYAANAENHQAAKIIEEAAFAAESAAQADLLRHLIGNSFRPVAIDPGLVAWSGGLIPRLAEALYQEDHLPQGTLDPARFAVLADALEEAGCTDSDILNHCRQPGEHVPGCWLIDRLLGRG